MFEQTETAPPRCRCVTRDLTMVRKTQHEKQMKKTILILTALASLTIAGCSSDPDTNVKLWGSFASSTGQRFARLQPGMNRNQAISLLGRPKGYRRNGSYEILQYPNGLVNNSSWDTADFQVILHNGVVESYGAADVRQGPQPQLVLVAPL